MATLGGVIRTFTARDLMKIGKRLDRVARQRAEEDHAPTSENREDAVERQNRRLRELLRQRSTSRPVQQRSTATVLASAVPAKPQPTA